MGLTLGRPHRMIPNMRIVSIGALLASFRLLTAGVVAGEPSAASPATEVSEPPFSMALTLGVDSRYIFRGEELFDETHWGQLDAAYQLTEAASLSILAWYAESPDAKYNEIDLQANLAFDLGFAEVSVGYMDYRYPKGAFGGDEGLGREDEIVLGIDKTVGIVDLGVLAAYNMDREGTYFEVSAGMSLALGDRVAFEPSLAVGYSSNYFAEDGFSHALLTVALPISLLENVTLKPYVAGNLPLTALDENQDFRVFGGLAFEVAF
jgi:hypothetical protein